MVSGVAVEPLMRHTESLFVAPLHQTPPGALCLLGCSVRMCPGQSFFPQLSLKQTFLPCPCLTAHKVTLAASDTYLGERQEQCGTHLHCVVVAGFVIYVLCACGKIKHHL